MGLLTLAMGFMTLAAELEWSEDHRQSPIPSPQRKLR